MDCVSVDLQLMDNPAFSNFDNINSDRVILFSSLACANKSSTIYPQGRFEKHASKLNRWLLMGCLPAESEVICIVGPRGGVRHEVAFESCFYRLVWNHLCHWMNLGIWIKSYPDNATMRKHGKESWEEFPSGNHKPGKLLGSRYDEDIWIYETIVNV